MLQVTGVVVGDPERQGVTWRERLQLVEQLRDVLALAGQRVLPASA